MKENEQQRNLKDLNKREYIYTYIFFFLILVGFIDF